MALDRYIHAVFRMWYFPLALAIIGILGTMSYFAVTGTTTASATVAVLEPAVLQSQTATPGSGQALITFDSIAESRMVAQQVINRLHLNMSPDALQGLVSVKLSKQLVTNGASPLYLVQVKDRDGAQAQQILNAVITESTTEFENFNRTDPTQINAAFQGEEQAMQHNVTAAQDALTQFEQTNNAWNLPSQVDAETTLVNNLRQTDLVNQANPSITSAGRAVTQQQLATAEDELAQLRGMQAEYNRLTFNVDVDQGLVSDYVGKEADLTVAGDKAGLAIAQQGEATARTQLVAARQALATFQTANDIEDLPTDISNQLGIVTDLRRQILAAATTTDALQNAINQENGSLQHMRSLLPQYNALDANVSQAEAQYAQLQAREIDAIVSGDVVPSGQVRVLDGPIVQSNAVLAALSYIAGALLGIFLGLIIVYVLAYFDPTPRTVEDAGEIIGAPVLARIPDAF